MAEGLSEIQIGTIIKYERQKVGYTRAQIAERAGIGERYLVAIENNEKKPKFDVLYRLLRSIGMSADKLFYPEKSAEEIGEHERLVNLLKTCDRREQALAAAVIDTLIDTRGKSLGQGQDIKQDKNA